MNNETDVSIKFKNSVTGEKKLKEYAETLKTIKAVLSGMDEGKIKALDEASKNMQQINKESKNTKNNMQQLSKDSQIAAKNFNLAFNYTALRTFTRIMQSTVRTMSKMVTKSSEYAENINLFQVAFDGAYEEADKFVNKLTEMYGLDESWLTKTVGLFKQLSNAMGLSTEQGTKLATLLTQMSVDISSLYNIDIDKASSVLQSALAGQTKPIRGATGADITVPTLQTTLDNLGIQKYASELSYAEKRLVIIISLTKQLNKATNDFGKTIESPANQMRILNEQWSRLTRAVGNVFMPLVSKLLPILNGVIMALVEIVNIIATIFGFDIKDYDYGVSALGESFLDLEDNMDGAAESAKKLKSGLRGFDKLNVITTPSSGTGAGASSGIDPEIMDAFNDAFNEYNSKLKEVQMKATKIRDNIMEWLGFTKEIDEETGKVSFKFDHITSGTVLGGLAVGGVIFSGIKAIFTMIGKIGNFSGLFGAFSAETLGTIMLIAGAIALVGYAIYDLYNNNEEFAKSVHEKWSGIKKAIQPVGELLKQLVGTLTTFVTETLLPMGEEIYKTIQTIVQVLIDVLYPIFVDVIIPVLGLLIEIINDIFTTLNELWTTYGQPIFEQLRTAIETLGNIFDNLWNQYIKPIVDKIMQIIKNLWENTLHPMFEKLGQAIGGIIEVLLILWNNVLAPLVKYIIDIFGPTFDTIFSFICDIVDGAIKLIGGVINGLLDVLNGIIKFLKGVFTGDWKMAWQGVKDIFKGVINVMISIAEGLVNSIITLINLMIKAIYNGIKSLINSVLGVVEGIADFLGFDIDIKLKGSAPQIPLVNIPRLKVGLDFVPNDYYPAYLDYGERVLTKEENRDYTAHLQGIDNDSKKQTFNPTFIIQVGDEKLTNVVLENLQDMATTNGKPIVIGGA